MTPRHRFLLGSVLVSVLWLVVIGLLLRLAPKMAPIQRGSAREFWKYACSVGLERDVVPSGGFVYGPRDGWYFYERRHMHGSDLFRVPQAEVEDLLDWALQQVRESPEEDDRIRDAQWGAAEWDCLNLEGQAEIEQLLRAIQAARLQRWKTAHPDKFPDLYHYTQMAEFQFKERYQRSRWYWATVAFEGLSLCGLVLFALWPLLRGQGWLAWALHLGAVPFLLMLPLYLGYAVASYSSAGPSGGVLYPWVYMHLTGSLFGRADYLVIPYLPQVLEPLSPQGGSAMVLSWRSAPGPFTTLAVGGALATAIFALHWWVTKSRSKLAGPASNA
jgi:hypothetical protein